MSTTFAGLGLPADLVAALSREGINEPFPIQALTIRDAPRRPRHLRQGEDRLRQDPRLRAPAALPDRPGATPATRAALVLVPTRELANQVTDRAARARHARANGASAPSTAACRWTRRSTALRKGVDVVVGTPGRLIDLMERGELSVTEVEVLVIDEADRMADMGFMPQVQKILYRMTQPHQTMLFSATLDGAVKRLVDRYMDDPVQHLGRGDRADGRGDGAPLLPRAPDGQGQGRRHRSREACERTLVFVRTKRGADRLVTQLRA